MKKIVREAVNALKAVAEEEGIALLSCEIQRSGHHHLRWRRPDGSEFRTFMPASPSCRRSGLNAINDLKRAAKKL